MNTPSHIQLPLTATSSCGCCSTSEARSVPSAPSGVEYGVEGMTCGGCAGRVESAVKNVEGVDSATIELVPGGVSSLVVTGSAGSAAISQAVTAAGYSLTNR